MKEFTYNQKSKKQIRHEVLMNSIDLLTNRRSNSSCVDRGYVRRVYDYFMGLDESKEQVETSLIDVSYINYWEKLYDSYIGYKRPEDLNVCYLSGPEPQNDFDELMNLGILPQNIWAFENSNTVYTAAIEQISGVGFPQPKIVKTPIEQFFRQTPKMFDIVYIDACGSVPSNQHAMRCVATLAKYHRLISPGIVITNFSNYDVSKLDSINLNIKLIALYLLCKKQPNCQLVEVENKIYSSELQALENEIQKNVSEYYGEFLSDVIRDINSVFVPIQRFVNSTYLSLLISDSEKIKRKKISLNEINLVKNNSLYKFLLIVKWINENSDDNEYKSKMQSFIAEITGIDDYKIDIIDSFDILFRLKSNSLLLKNEIKDIVAEIESSEEFYQFLDKPNSNLFFDLIVNQLSYPMHYNSQEHLCYMYTAKKNEMFTDILVLDDCRYIYEWIPTIHQILNAFKDKSWQYVFRFALDGLVKQRIKYNNEFFYQGSVIHRTEKGFEEKEIKKRIKII